MCANVILASSAAFFASAGRTNICGTIQLIDWLPNYNLKKRKERKKARGLKPHGPLSALEFSVN